MSQRISISTGRLPTTLAIAFLCAMVLPSVVFSAENAADIPRRSDGKPDLSGTYDIATLTPRVRPAKYGDRLDLTAEEAAALESHWKGNLAKDFEPSDPNRGAPPEGGVGIYVPEFTGAAGKVGGYNAFFVDIGDSAFKLDGKYRTSILTDPPNGRYPALSKEGKLRREKRAAFRHENTGTAWWLDMDSGPYDDPEVRPLAERCIFTSGATGPPSMPGMYNNLKTIVQTDDYVMILVEWMHDARIIRMNAEHGPSTVRTYTGDSVGHWEGDTLVVDTINFKEMQGDSRSADQMHVVERFSRIDGDTLLYQFTVDDPSYDEPWSGEYPWPATENLLYEYACHEGNYAMGGILRGARLLENEALAQRADGSTDGDG